MNLRSAITRLVAPVGLGLLVVVGSLASARADPRPSPAPPNRVEGRLLLGLPAALPTGLSTGFDLAYTRGSWLAWGVRAGWSSATEYTLTRTVRNDDIRLRLLGLLRYASGRGSLGLRLGLGLTVVHESRELSQGERAQLQGQELGATVWSALPAADLELTAAVRLVRGFGLTIGGGPVAHLLDGALHMGWSAAGGLFWQG